MPAICACEPPRPSSPAACRLLLRALTTGRTENFERISHAGERRLVNPGRLTVGGEPDKLAANIAIGRSIGGIH